MALDLSFLSDPKFKRYAGETLQDLGYGLSQAPDFFSGLGYATQRTAQMQPARDAYTQSLKEEGQRTDQINQTIEFLRSKGREDLIPLVGAGQASMALTQAMAPPKSAYENAPASVQEYQFYSDQARAAGQEPAPYDEWRKGSNQTVKAGLGQPIPLRNKATGETVPFMPMSDGTYINPLTQTVADDSWEFDPAYISAQKAQGTTLGKEVAGAQFDLPGAKLAVEQSLGAIQDIRSQEKGMKEQFGNILGVPQQITPAWPGSDKAKFQVAVQRGVDRSFMEAREALRGGGQITDFEGKKAETAISNMQLAIEKGDEAQFTKALNDFEQAVKDGYRKLEQQAGSLPTVGTGSRPSGGAADPLGIR